MKKKLLALIFCFILIFAQITQSYCSSSSPLPNSHDSYITLELDKAKANVGDIIKATVRINGSNILSGYQVNITYDPEVLQPVNPYTGKAYKDNTNPLPGNILVNEAYQPVDYAQNNINNGILNFGRIYVDKDTYEKSGVYETTGITDIIGFKVISPAVINTGVYFTGTPLMPGAVSGTFLADAEGKLLTSFDYYVLQPGDIYLNDYIPLPPPTPKNFKLSGFVNPDIEAYGSTSPDIKADFNVSISTIEGTLNATTDSNGYFELNDVPLNPSGYSILIYKEGYLSRVIDYIQVTKDTMISYEYSPIKIWAGDMTSNGSINIADIMEIAGHFNTSSSDQNYDKACDFNIDSCINILDIMIAVKHFNRSAVDYPRF